MWHGSGILACLLPVEVLMLRALLMIAGVTAVPIAAQMPSTLHVPEAHPGSPAKPSTVAVPHAAKQLESGSRLLPETSPAAPASTELLATRHFDFIVSPIAPAPSPRGTMADSSISLGEYARRLRAGKRRTAGNTAPNSMARRYDFP